MSTKLIAEASASRCPRCDSTERSEYHGTTERQISGTDSTGKPYTHVIWRRTTCTACGQQRVDRSYQNRKRKRRPVAQPETSSPESGELVLPPESTGETSAAGA